MLLARRARFGVIYDRLRRLLYTFFSVTVRGVRSAFCDPKIGKIRVKNREPVPVYAMEMDPQERESELGEDSPVVST